MASLTAKVPTEVFIFSVGDKREYASCAFRISFAADSLSRLRASDVNGIPTEGSDHKRCGRDRSLGLHSIDYIPVLIREVIGNDFFYVHYVG